MKKLTGLILFFALLISIILKLKIAIFAFAGGFENDIDCFLIIISFIKCDRFAADISALNRAEKFFFATDFPMWDAKAELERFNSIPLTDKEKEMILSGNIKRLLKL